MIQADRVFQLIFINKNCPEQRFSFEFSGKNTMQEVKKRLLSFYSENIPDITGFQLIRQDTLTDNADDAISYDYFDEKHKSKNIFQFIELIKEKKIYVETSHNEIPQVYFQIVQKEKGEDDEYEEEDSKEKLEKEESEYDKEENDDEYEEESNEIKDDDDDENDEDEKEEKEIIIAHFEQDNYTIDSSLYKNISDYKRICQINNKSGYVDKYKNRKNGKFVSIKSIYTDEENLNYKQEIQVLTKLHHPTINTLLGLIEDEEESMIHIITPFYKNGNLTKIKKLSPDNFDFTQKYIVAYGIAVGMMILHKNNIIHRDLRPESILLTDDFEPMINDFCFSVHIDDDDGNYKPQENCLATVTSMTPEIISVGREFLNYCQINGKLADVFSYAMICYQVFTGQVPFGNFKNTFPIIKAIKNENRPEIPDGFNTAISELIQKCWNQNPKMRPSFDEIVRTLGSKNFIKKVDKIDIERFSKYQEKVTPIELIEKVDDDEDDTIQIKVDLSDFKIDPSLIKDLSKFTKIAIIGKGSFGCVFNYKETETGEIFAVKKILSEINNDKDLQREIIISSSLHHPTLHPLCGVSINNDDDCVCLFTPFCSKGDLQHLIENSEVSEKLNPTQKYIIIYGIAAGMYFLHRNNLIHRDLKPGNVLLSDGLEPLITDFGCSKIIDLSNEFYQTEMKGTTLFLAPEIVLSQNLEYDGKKADVYAFAILCYQILTGKRPFGNIKFIDLPEILSNERRPEFPEQFNDALKELVENCWKQNPAERYSFEDVLLLMGDMDFIEKVGGIDIEKFNEYQKKVVSKKFIKV